jgi:hypothetical protein
MGCHPSHWRTHIFQDGYCTTNQLIIIEIFNNKIHQIFPELRSGGSVAAPFVLVRLEEANDLFGSVSR